MAVYVAPPLCILFYHQQRDTIDKWDESDGIILLE